MKHLAWQFTERDAHSAAAAFLRPEVFSDLTQITQGILSLLIQDRTSPPTVQDDKHSTGWCYTMLQPARSPPVSSDPPAYASTTGREKKKEKKRERERSQGGA